MIGDIDLILQNIKTKEFLLIESKSHALILDVQARDSEKAFEKLNEQKTKWEKKVQQRIKYIDNNHSLGFKENYRYIIVSKNPEILSHFSELMVLSIREFRFWLDSGEPTSFDEMFSDMYDKSIFKETTIKELYGNTFYAKKR